MIKRFGGLMSNRKIITIMCIASSLMITCSFADNADATTAPTANQLDRKAPRGQYADPQPISSAASAASVEQRSFDIASASKATVEPAPTAETAGVLVDQMLKNGRVSHSAARDEMGNEKAFGPDKAEENRLALISEDGVAFKPSEDITKTLPSDMREGWYFLSYDLAKTEKDLTDGRVSSGQDGPQRDPRDEATRARRDFPNTPEVQRDNYRTDDFRRPGEQEISDRREENFRGMTEGQKEDVRDQTRSRADAKQVVTMQCSPKEGPIGPDGKKTVEFKCTVVQ